ncbi:MAG: uracil phosphoribosyltransferase [Candidatus Peregrinibacteria bacterium Gr01-1014_25]|nr:MAG: uracil phosphoribosyltransferase [Candidatus Peregrinibacteria bacterium Gr01-1014_25]
MIRQLQRAVRKEGIAPHSIVFVVILRSGVAFLPPALKAFPTARVAVLGLKRDEKTAVAHWYYANVPKLASKDTVIILDPMLATGGSAKEAVLKLKKCGANLRRMMFVGVIAAPEGVRVLQQFIPRKRMILGSVDRGLDARKYIVPGLGDFGDRYFGYES